MTARQDYGRLGQGERGKEEIGNMAARLSKISAEICGNVENDKSGEQAEDNFL